MFSLGLGEIPSGWQALMFSLGLGEIPSGAPNRTPLWNVRAVGSDLVYPAIVFVFQLLINTNQ